MSVPRVDQPLVPPSSRSSETPLEIELLTSQEQFYALATEWNPLVDASSSPSIFLTWEWIATWWKIFGAGMRPWILAARERRTRRLLGLAPFLLRRHPLRSGPWRELSLWGSTAASGDHLDVLLRRGHEEAVVAGFAEALASHCRQWDVISLDRMDSGSLLAGLLRQRARRPLMVWESLCPFLRLPGHWEEMQSMLAKNTRRNLRKASHRLHRAVNGAVVFQWVHSADQVPAALEELFRLHQDLWIARGHRGAFHDPAVRRFHQQIAACLVEKGQLHLCLLRVDGQAIAVDYGFSYGGTVSVYQGGYDRAWEHYSPGSLLTAEMIRTSIQEEQCEIDFLRGEERYKALWTHTAHRDLRWRIATTARGAALVHAYRILHAARSRLRQWRPDSICSKGAFTCFD